LTRVEENWTVTIFYMIYVGGVYYSCTFFYLSSCLDWETAKELKRSLFVWLQFKDFWFQSRESNTGFLTANRTLLSPGPDLQGSEPWHFRISRKNWSLCFNYWQKSRLYWSKYLKKSVLSKLPGGKSGQDNHIFQQIGAAARSWTLERKVQISVPSAVFDFMIWELKSGAETAQIEWRDRTEKEKKINPML